MKGTSLIFSLTVFCALDVGTAIAQSSLDPSSQSLLGSGKSPEPEDLDTSRFTKVPDSPAPVEPKRIKGTPEPASQKSSPKVKIVNKVQVKTVIAPAPAPVASPTPPTAFAPPKPSIPDQMRTLILGGSQEEIDEFKKQINPEDRRNNRIELNVAPAYFYHNSTSNYSIRNFDSSGTAVDVGANIWLSPFFGLHADVFTSLESNVSSDGPKKSIPLDHQNIEIGMRFRKHFGVTRKAPSLNWGLDFIDNKTKVPAETPDRVTTETSGLSLSLQADIPTSIGYSHMLGIQVAPRLIQSETSLANIHSGGSVDTDALGVWFGGTVVFDRQNQIFWKFKESIEQNTFGTQASAPDPHTGTTPQGVSVTNSMTVFSIGYTWGD